MVKGDEAEQAVKRFLQLIDDPAQLIDRAAVAKAEKVLSTATDPIDKLKAHAAKERAESPPTAEVVAGFIEHGQAWAEANNVPASAFKRMGVDTEVLVRARIMTAQNGSRGTTRSGGPRQRAKAVPVEDIKPWVLGQKGSFTLVDVMSGIGGSPATVRKVVDELIADGKVTKLGPMRDYQGRGRAPIVYQVA